MCPYCSSLSEQVYSWVDMNTNFGGMYSVMDNWNVTKAYYIITDCFVKVGDPSQGSKGTALQGRLHLER